MKIWPLLIIILSIPSVMSPDYNTLDPEDLADAIKDNKISDFSSIKEEVLAEAIKSDVSILSLIPSNDLVRVINKENSLMTNHPEVVAEIERRASSDTRILNDNPKIKGLWFASYNIQDTGARIKSLSNKKVTTDGPESTQFDVELIGKVYIGSQVTPSGKLILNNGVQIASASVTMPGGVLNVVGGNVILPPNSKTIPQIYVTNGRITQKIGVESYIFQSKNKMEVGAFKYEGYPGFQISGNEVIVNVIGETSGPTKYKFDGTMKYFGSVKMLGANSRYTEFGKDSSETDREVLRLTVSKDTGIMNNRECGIKPPCISINYNNKVSAAGDSIRRKIDVSPGGNSNIFIEDLSGHVTDVKVPAILDNSQVSFKQGGTEVVMTKGPMVYKGDLSKVSAKIVNSFYQSKTIVNGEPTGSPRIQYIKGGKMYFCPENKGCPELANSKLNPPNPQVRIVHIAANVLTGQSATYSSAKEQGNIAFEGYTAETISAAGADNSDVLLISGHHYTGGGESGRGTDCGGFGCGVSQGEPVLNIWGDESEAAVTPETLPGLTPGAHGPRVVGFSSCHTVMNPEYGPGRGADMIEELTSKYPNVEVIFGYDTTAPLDDSNVWKAVTPLLANSKTQDPKQLGQAIVATGDAALRKDGWGQGNEKTNPATNNGDPWAYGLRDKEGKRMSVYVKQGNEWYFYSSLHPEGIKVKR